VFLLRWQDWPLQWPFYALCVTAWLYLLGGRASATPASAGKRWRGAAFYGGILALVLAIDSPIDVYADSLFWVHMVQHVLLMLVAPPLVLLGRPWPRLTRPLPIDVRRPLARTVLVGGTLAPLRRALRFLATPLPAFALFNVTLLAWHVPRLYDLTLRYGLVHDLEHAMFFGTALLFWSHLVPGAVSRPQLGDGQRVAYATGGMLVSWLLAVVLGLASHPLYPAYAALTHRPGGISALADQQLAAGVMWVPGSVPYTIVLFAAAFRWLDPAGASRRKIELRPREIL
jgi:cytochrome c oxidase assembly factor CtaG